MKYNYTLIGRALVLSKLEEVAMLLLQCQRKSLKMQKCSYVDAMGAFDKRMDDVINFWKSHLHNAKLES